MFMFQSRHLVGTVISEWCASGLVTALSELQTVLLYSAASQYHKRWPVLLDRKVS